MSRISYADMADDLYTAMHDFIMMDEDCKEYVMMPHVWAFAWLEAMGPQEFLEMMGEV